MDMNAPRIGLWWYTDKHEVWATSTTKEFGVIEKNHIIRSKTISHSDIWRDIVESNADSDAVYDELIQEKYDVFEYGSVEYNFLTQRYEIICSGVLYNDVEFRKKILKSFHLEHERIEFVLRVD